MGCCSEIRDYEVVDIKKFNGSFGNIGMEKLCSNQQKGVCLTITLLRTVYEWVKLLLLMMFHRAKVINPLPSKT
jgi:hypothetical protein